MSEKKKKKKKKINTTINWKLFQNDPDEFEFLRGILAILEKYTSIGIAELVSSYKTDQLTRDHIRLAAANVFLAVHAGKAEGDFLKAGGTRKSRRGSDFIKIKEAAEAEGEKITDNMATNKAEAASRKTRLVEARAFEKKEIYSAVMHRVNKLIDTFETVQRAFYAEEKRVT